MSAFEWIVTSGFAMSAIALVGSTTLVLSESTLQRIILTLVALVAGFSTFFGLEQVLHWHHCHRAVASCKQPLTYLVLIGDGLHNFIGGLAIAGTFLIDIRLGITAWLAAAAHEIPQELGDFGVLIHGG
jgi:zinc and cadmium transporter